MRQVLNSLTIKGVLRDYARQLEWVDAKLYRMLHSTLAMTEADTQLEATMLCEAIRYYQEDCRSRANCLYQDLPHRNRPIHLLAFKRNIMDSHVLWPLARTLRKWKLKYPTHSFEDCEPPGEATELAVRVSNFVVHFDTSDFGGEIHNPLRSPETSSLRKFDGVVYMMNSAVHCHVRRSLLDQLKCLMTSAGSITPDVMLRPRILLILDVDSEQTENSTFRCGHFQSLFANLHKYFDVILREIGESLVSADTCNWWRVWRIHQRNDIFVNMHEAFQWVTLQITTANGEGSSQDSSEGHDNATAI